MWEILLKRLNKLNYKSITRLILKFCDLQIHGYMKYDFIVVGAGILGLSTAYSLISKYPKSKIIIIEKERDFFKHQSGNNSNVIHSGIYYKPDPVKP